MHTLDHKFSFSSFLRASSAQREELCAALTIWVKKEILSLTQGQDDPRRRKVIDDMITPLRQLGHDLILDDWSDYFEEYIPNYGVPDSAGLWIRIDFKDDTEIFWHEFPKVSSGEVVT